MSTAQLRPLLPKPLGEDRDGARILINQVPPQPAASVLLTVRQGSFDEDTRPSKILLVVVLAVWDHLLT